MKIKDDEKFIKIVEGLIDPAEVSTIYFFNTFKKLLPKKMFKKLLIKTSKQSPYMGFVIEPYSLFLFYKIKDIEKARSILPDRYELTKAKVFNDDEPGYYYGMGIFNTRATTFWGTRLESYLIARDRETGLLSWIFIDILSDTIIALPKEGIVDPNTSKAVYTTSSKGDIYLDFQEAKTNRQLKVNGNLKKGIMRNLDQELWVTGNTSIAHSKALMDQDDEPFAVIFDPAEVKEAMDLPLEDFSLLSHSILPDFAEPKLCQVACFPFTQHYIADSPGCRTYIKNTDDMIEKYNEIAELKKIDAFSTKSIKRQFLLGIISSFMVSIILFVLLMLNI